MLVELKQAGVFPRHPKSHQLLRGDRALAACAKRIQTNPHHQPQYQHRAAKRRALANHWMLGVGCWMLDVAPGFLGCLADWLSTVPGLPPFLTSSSNIS